MFPRGRPHDLASCCFRLLRFAIGKREPKIRVSEEHRYAIWVPVHHRFLTGTILDPQHANLFVLHLDGVMLGINLNRIWSRRPRRRLWCWLGCHKRGTSFQLPRVYARPHLKSIPSKDARYTVAFMKRRHFLGAYSYAPASAIRFRAAALSLRFLG